MEMKKMPNKKTNNKAIVVFEIADVLH